MPTIKEYDAGNLGLRPTESGIDARVQAARRIQTFANQAAGAITSAAEAGVTAAGDVARSASGAVNAVIEDLQQQEKYAGHREVSQGAAAGAQLFSDLTDEWDRTVKKADPNDPSVAAKFREQQLEPALQRFKDAHSSTDLGQEWSDKHVASMRNHFFQKTAADMSTLAGAAVEVNVRQLANASSNAAGKSADPHTIDYLLGQVDNSVGAIIDSSNVKGAEATKLRTKLSEQMKEQIVKAGAFAAILKSGNPEQTAQDYADRYPQYVNGDEARQFATAARGAKRMNDSEARAQRVQRDYENKNDFNTKINELEMATAPQNAGDPPRLPNDYWQKLRELSKHPGAGLEPGRLKTMVQNGEIITARLDKPEPLSRVSHDTTMGLLKRIRATDDSRLTDNSAIYEAYGRGDLTRADFNFSIQEFNNLRTPQGEALGKDRAEFFKRYAATVDGAMDMGGHSALGSQRMYAFEMEARRQEADLRKKGLDPHTLYDPSSPNFIGKQVAKYHVSFQEAQQFEKQVQGERKNLTANPPPTGIETIEQKPGAKTFVPPANWTFSATRQQYRDPQGQLYDVSGNKVK